ncbi:MAG: DUF2877 domain-containing protein [Spirochaeta sp.]|nr:DUF2877 domain-containing protein [Spirochaeta sp.]
MKRQGRGQSFKAKAVGDFVKRIFAHGEVISIHRGAVNILGGSGLLLSIVADFSSMTGLSLYLPAMFQNELLRKRQGEEGIVAGLKVRRRGNKLYLADMVISLDFRKTWNGRLSLADVAGFTEQNIDDLEKALLASEIEAGLIALHRSGLEGDHFVRKARKILAGLSLTGKPPLITGLSRLVGLGIGLTPSGDDFIAGALLGERIRQLLGNTDHKNFPFPAIEKAEISGALSKTAYSGRTLLWLALQGSFPHYLINAARALAAAAGLADIKLAVRSAALHGATSGSDALAGLLWYLRQVH